MEDHPAPRLVLACQDRSNVDPVSPVLRLTLLGRQVSASVRFPPWLVAAGCGGGHRTL